MTSSGKAIPIITIGGFLGAGKTTLVNRLLSQSADKRLVVFVNDFGAINIDYQLIETVDTDRIALTNGCVCCSLNDDLIKSISEFSQHDPPDAFVIEASGVADPRALEHSIAIMQAAGRVQLVCRVYVLDMKNIAALDYEDTEQLIDHAVASDLVLLNKADLVTGQSIEHWVTLLHRCAPQSILKPAQHCDITLQELLITDTSLASAYTMISSQATEDTRRAMNHDAARQYASWSCRAFAPLDRDVFEKLLDELRATALRAKGTLFFTDEPGKAFKFDFVGQQSSLYAIDKPVLTCKPEFVAIGYCKRFSQTRLSRHFTITDDAPV